MSLFRDQALGQIARVAEPVITGVAALWWGWIGLEAALAGRITAVLPLVGAGLAGAWCIVSLTRTVIALNRPGVQEAGPGVVTVQEGRIGYYGPEGGGFVRVSELLSIDLVRAGLPDRREWLFTDVSGATLRIPNEAEGADQLPDALDVLPGLTYQQLATALLTSRQGGEGLWRRPSGPDSQSNKRI